MGNIWCERFDSTNMGIRDAHGLVKPNESKRESEDKRDVVWLGSYYSKTCLQRSPQSGLAGQVVFE